VKNHIVFAEHNFCLVNFYFLLAECEVGLITDLHDYGLLKTEKITKDVKTLLLHHLIHHICEYVLKYKGKEKNVIYYSDQIPNTIQLLKHFQETDLETLFKKTVQKLKKVLPLRIHCNHLEFREIFYSKQGKREEIIARIKQTLDSTDITQFSFSKTNLFTKRYKLTFLNKEYFNSIKTKQLLIA